ncbi:MAG: RNA polymerase sigma factor [Longimicrobiales bacterium]
MGDRRSRTRHAPTRNQAAAHDRIAALYGANAVWMEDRAAAILGDRDEAADVVHRIFCRLLERKDLPRDIRRAYLGTSVRNECAHVRERRKRARQISEAMPGRGAALSPDGQRTMAREPFPGWSSDRDSTLSSAAAVRIVESLPRRSFEVVWAVACGCMYEEVADHFHISRKTVSAHVQRARRKGAAVGSATDAPDPRSDHTSKSRKHYSPPRITPGWP